MDDNKYKDALKIIQNTSKHIIESIDNEYENLITKVREKNLINDIKLNSIKPNKTLIKKILELEKSLNYKISVNKFISGEIQKFNCNHKQLIIDISKLIDTHSLIIQQ